MMENMKFYQLISKDGKFNFNQLLMNAHEQLPFKMLEQFPNGLKERVKQNYFNAFFVYKKKGIIYFIFGTNYINEHIPFKTNLKNSTDERMVYEDTKHISYLENFKYAKSIYKVKNDVNIYNEDLENLFIASLTDLPEDLLVSIKFRRSKRHYEQNITLSKNEKVLREKNRKTTNESTYMNEISKRTKQLNYLFDVEFQLVTKTDFSKNVDNPTIVNDKAKMLKYYNVLKTFMNNNVNNIKIDKFFSMYNIHKFFSKDCYTLEELEKLIYIPCAEDFNIPKSELPILYQDEAFYIPRDDEFNNPDDVNMGIIDHPLISKRHIYVPISKLSEHAITCGQTGSGKTADIIANLKSTIPIVGKKNHGFFYIDPKRTGAIKLLNHIMHLEQEGKEVDWDRIHYIDLNSGKYFPQLNLLHQVPYRDDSKIIDRTLELFKNVYDSGDTPLMDKMLKNIFGTLVLGKKDKIYKFEGKEIGKKKYDQLIKEGKEVTEEIIGATILDAIRLINDKKFREKIANNIPDGINREFKEFWKGEIKASDYNSTINRLTLFQPEKMKRLYGTYRLDLDFVKWANEGHIVIVDALDMSDHATTLLIGQCASLALEQILFNNQVPGFRVVVDEGKRAQVAALPRITAEGRQPGCWLHVLAQDINLMRDNFTKELISNVTTYKIGKHNDKSAKVMSNLIQNDVSANDISRLPNNTMILRTVNSKDEVVKMKVTNDLPFWYLKDGRIAEKDNQLEEEMAMNWTLKKAEELQKRDWLSKEEIDEILLNDYKDVMTKEKMLEQVDESVGIVKLA